MRINLDPRGLAIAAVACAAVATSGGAAQAAVHSCPGADTVPAANNVGAIERATLCLINRERAAHGRHRLHANHTLGKVAARYAHRMVAKSFFAHVSSTGSTFDQRIRDAGYLRGARGWSLGENLAWASGSLATPRHVVRMWMHSPEHRRNILDPHFRDAGLGVSLGVPVGGLRGATYANEFGERLS